MSPESSFSILWSYLDITLLFSSYVYLILSRVLLLFHSVLHLENRLVIIFFLSVVWRFSQEIIFSPATTIKAKIRSWVSNDRTRKLKIIFDDVNREVGRQEPVSCEPFHRECFYVTGTHFFYLCWNQNPDLFYYPPGVFPLAKVIFSFIKISSFSLPY